MSKVELLTAEECAEAASALLNRTVTVHSFTVKPYSKKTDGFLGEHYLVTVEVSDEVQEKTKVQFFAKACSTKNSLQGMYSTSIHSFQNEISTYGILFEEYKKIVPNFDRNFAPKYYWSSKNDLLLLEDLKVKGYRLAVKPYVNLLDLNHIRLVLTNLAKYHAASLTYEELKTKENGGRYKIVDKILELREPLYQKDDTFLGYKWFKACIKGLLGIIDLLPTSVLPPTEFKEKLINLANASIEKMQPSKKFRNAICHGDLWSNNIMFKYHENRPIDCKIIDFELQHYLPPAQDVLHFIFETTNREMRQHHLHDLLRYYYAQLKQQLAGASTDIEKVLPMGEFWESVVYFLPQVKLEVANSYTLITTGQHFHNQLLKDPRLYEEFFFKDRTKPAVEFYQTNSHFRYCLTEILEELGEALKYPRISREDCYEIMEEYLGTTYYRFRSFDVRSIDEVLGYLGNYFKIRIDYVFEDEERTLDAFLKAMPTSKASTAFLQDTGCFDKEVFFYETVVALGDSLEMGILNECIPKCFLLRSNDMVIFEDLSAKDYKVQPTHLIMDYQHLLVGARVLAKFHASMLLIEEKMSKVFNQKYRLVDHYPDGVKETLFFRDYTSDAGRFTDVALNGITFCIEKYSHLFPDYCGRSFKEFWKDRRNYIYEIGNLAKTFRSILCHGDLWASNIMFKYQEDQPIDCCLIDYQQMRYAPPVHDLLCLLYLNTDRMTRAKCTEKIIENYYRELTNYIENYGYSIEKVYPKDQFMDSLQQMKFHTIIMTAIYYPFIMSSSEDRSVFLNNDEISHKTFYEDRTEYLEEMLKKSERYRNRVIETLLDLYGYFKEQVRN